MRNRKAVSAVKETPKPTAEMDALLRRAGGNNVDSALAASHELAKALEIPLRQGVLYGAIFSDLFQTINFTQSQLIDFPLDFLAPGTEKNHVAYTIPNHGRIPERHVEGDVIQIGTFEIASSIDFLSKYARDARWDVVGRAMQVLEASFIKKKNDDAFHTLLAAAVDRNIVVYDSAAAPGTLTKRLISLMQQVERRSYGGNTASVNRGKLTDIWMSPEALEDIRNWGYAELDEVTRREVFEAADGVLNKVFGVYLHDITELGVGQQYQNYYLNELGGTLASADTELLLGADLSDGPGAGGVFINPVREPLQIFEDPHMFRQRRLSWFGWEELGWGVLDSRKLVLGSL